MLPRDPAAEFGRSGQRRHLLARVQRRCILLQKSRRGCRRETHESHHGINVRSCMDSGTVFRTDAIIESNASICCGDLYRNGWGDPSAPLRHGYAGACRRGGGV